MQRKEFLQKSGTIITAAAFISLLPSRSMGNVLAYDEPKGAAKRPNPNGFEQSILKGIAWGVNAPSPHNTQSWKFKILNDTEMLLFVDENILLPATDPPARQIHIGAGCFIETLAIASTTLGYDTKVVLFPEGYHSEKDFGIKPVAKISLVQKAVKADPLSAFITKRQTNREKYHGAIITDSEFEQITQLAGKSHSTILFKNKGLEPFLNIFYKGLDVESRTFVTNEETRKLFRFTAEQMAEKGNGLSFAQMGYKGLMKNIVTLAVDNGNPKKWHSSKSIDMSMKKIKSAIDTSKGIVFWKTATNHFHDWIETGRDYVRFSLALTSFGLFAHPYNQAIQEYDEMKQVREELNNLMQIKESEKIQMIVRIGRASTPFLSYRKQVNKFLTN